MTDRELLELAAKAAGIQLEWDGPPDQWVPMYYEGKTYHGWNPLEDDGDALRLAVNLRITVSLASVETSRDIYAQPPLMKSIFEPVGEDIHAATRRAIVRAAAEIGKSK